MEDTRQNFGNSNRSYGKDFTLVDKLFSIPEKVVCRAIYALESRSMI